MPLETTPFDPLKYLKTPGEIAELLDDAFSSGSAAYIRRAMLIAGRNYGMTKLAKQTGLNRQALYQSLSHEGNPTLDTVMLCLSTMGYRLRADRPD
jgi:probable addiction module antidote protein